MPLITAIWTVLCQLAPWLLLGMLLSGLMHVLLPADFIRRKFQGKSGVFKSVLFGVPLPLCSCGVVPAGIGLKKDGASDGAAVAFLISTPQTGVDSILVAASFLGWPFAIFKVVVAGVTGIIGGLLCGTQASVPPARSESVHDHPTNSRGFTQLLSHSLEIIRSIWFWLLLGIIVSAAIEVWLPTSVFQSVRSWGAAPAAIVALLISLPLYVCATASVPIAATLVAGGFPPGAALVFLMAGPATNIATIGAIYREFGKRTVTVYLLTLILGSILAAVAFDHLIESTALPTHSQDHAHDYSTWWAQLSAIILIAMIAKFAFDDFRRWLQPKSPIDRDTANHVIGVDGMTCNGCADKLASHLRNTDGVESNIVDLENAEAAVVGSVSESDLFDAVRNAGFQPRRL